MTVKEYSTVAKILMCQALVIVFVSLGFMAGGEQKALSSACGGLAALVPNAYFALRIFSVKEKDARKALKSIYVGEAVKLMLTIGMFALIFQITSIELLPLFVGFVSALSVFWFALLMR